MTKQSIEKPLLIICGLALLLGLLDVWWSAYVFIISFCTLSFFYSLFSVLPDSEKVNAQSLKKLVSKGYRMKSLINLFGGNCLAIIIIGIVAKLQIWWWANNALQFYLILASILSVLSFIRKNNWLAIRLLFFIVIACILYFIPFESIIEYKYRNHPEYKKEAYEYLERDLIYR